MLLANSSGPMLVLAVVITLACQAVCSAALLWTPQHSIAQHRTATPEEQQASQVVNQVQQQQATNSSSKQRAVLPGGALHSSY